jgi:hypothetical protein
MAKSRHNPQPQETSPRGMLAILTIGALLVAGLVVWALTRTVEPTVETPVSTVETATPAPQIDTAATAAPAIDTAALVPPATTAGITTSSQAPVISGDKDEVARISAEDLREKVKAGTVTVVDVRDALSFQSGHIPGSLNIPLASVQANLDLLPKGKQVVTYCT